jgi:hypothetical protein
MLHVLSPAVMKAPGNTLERARVASDWIGSQVSEYWKTRNEKLFRRYIRLDRYFKAFLVDKSKSS